jgi:hypothetical protein
MVAADRTVDGPDAGVCAMRGGLRACGRVTNDSLRVRPPGSRPPHPIGAARDERISNGPRLSERLLRESRV